MKKNLLRNAFLLIPALAMLVSCVQERMIGNYYVKHSPKAILLMRPDLVYKNNYMRFDSSDMKSEAEKDSIAFYRSSYLQYMSDSAFIGEYMDSLVERLLSAGFDVYAPEYRDSFMKVGPPSYIVNVAQLQMEESQDTSGSIDGDGNYYSTGIALKTLTLNSWFEVTEMKVDSGKFKKVLFASSGAQDEMKIVMNKLRNTPEDQIEFKIDTLNMNDVYVLGGQSGKIYGDYLTDYILNEYIRSQMPNGAAPQYYMHYDIDRHSVWNSQEEGFQEL